MDLSSLQWLFDWLRANPQWAGWLIGLAAFFEGLAMVGFLMPGATVLFGVGALVGLGYIDLTTAWVAASIGAFLGDGLSFWLGWKYRDRIRIHPWMQRHQDVLLRAERFFLRHGGKSVFIGRFVGPVRSAIPLIGGMMGMSWWKYLPINLVASILWSPFYILPGVVFGASLELASAAAGRLALLAGLLLAALWGVWWLVVRIYRYLVPRADRWLDRMEAWVERHPLLGRWAAALVDPRKRESASLIWLALGLFVLAWLFFALLLAISARGHWLALDERIWQGFQQMRSPWVDWLAAWLAAWTHVGNVLLLSVLAAGMLWWFRGRMAALHLLASAAFGVWVSWGLGQLLSVPLPVEADPRVFAFPGMDITVSAAVYGYLAVLLARELPGRRPAWPYVAATSLLLVSSTARLYLGLHWFSDVLAGWWLGYMWGFGLGLAWRIRSRERFPHRWLLTGFGAIALLIAALGLQTGQVLQAAQPRMLVMQGSEALPSVPDRRGLWMLTTMPPERLRAGLRDSGWEAGPAVSLQGSFAWLDPTAEPMQLPLPPRGLYGASVQGEWRKPADDGIWLLRSWPSPWLWKNGRPLYLLQVTRVRLQPVLGLLVWPRFDRPEVQALRRQLPAGWQLAGPRSDWWWLSPEEAVTSPRAERHVPQARRWHGKNGDSRKTPGEPKAVKGEGPGAPDGVSHPPERPSSVPVNPRAETPAHHAGGSARR